MMKTQAELILKSIECEISGSRWECAVIECTDGWGIGLVAQYSSNSIMVDSEIMSYVGRAIEDFDAELVVGEENVRRSLEYSEDRVVVMIQ